LLRVFSPTSLAVFTKSCWTDTSSLSAFGMIIACGRKSDLCFDLHTAHKRRNLLLAAYFWREQTRNKACSPAEMVRFTPFGCAVFIAARWAGVPNRKWSDWGVRNKRLAVRLRAASIAHVISSGAESSLHVLRQEFALPYAMSSNHSRVSAGSRITSCECCARAANAPDKSSVCGLNTPVQP
jgi:hypothetical protein